MIGRMPTTVEIEGFSGPFDLLVRLIERRELDLLAISLAAVTEQYLEQLAALQLRDPEHLSAFLVVAAKLVLIKSALLLPSTRRPSVAEDPEVSPTVLARRLQIYRAYREAASWLAAREEEGLRSYPRPVVADCPVAPAPFVPLDPALLREAYRRAQSRPKAEPEVESLPAESRLSVAEALELLRNALEQYRRICFGDLVPPGESRQRYVAMFLAILEAVRGGLVNVEQPEPFGEILISPREVAPAPASPDRLARVEAGSMQTDSD